MHKNAYALLVGGNTEITTMNGVQLIQRGLPGGALLRGAEIMEIELETYRELAHDTRKRSTIRNQRLSPITSERVLMMTEVYILAVEYFASHEKAVRWLHKPNLNLRYVSPISLCDTVLGMRVLKEEIQKLKHGLLC